MSSAVETKTAIKEEEIRPDALFAKFMDLCIEDAHNFFDKSRFVTVLCPGCGSETVTKEGFDKHSFHYDHCADCGTIYANPRPSASDLLDYYATSKSQDFWANEVLRITGEKRVQSIMVPNVERIGRLLSERNRAPETVLDVGAATGVFLSEWKKRHPETKALKGIEPGKSAAQQCRDKGVEVFEGFVEDVAGKNGAVGDLVTCFEVVEHIWTPANFARAMYNCTKERGVAVMSCLGADGFDIQLLWQDARAITPPYHLNFLSKKGMEVLFSKAGFSRIEVLTPGRLDVNIVKRTIERGTDAKLSRFEKLLLSRGEETHNAFQKFLAENALSSHVWIIAYR